MPNLPVNASAANVTPDDKGDAAQQLHTLEERQQLVPDCDSWEKHYAHRIAEGAD